MTEPKDEFTTDDILPDDQVEAEYEWIDGGPKSRLVAMRLIRGGEIVAMSRPKNCDAG